MAYDQRLASRIRVLLEGRRGIKERRMFGGLAFLLNGRMACGVQDATLVLRLGREGAAAALKRRHTRAMDFTGRTLASMVYVDPRGCRRDTNLRDWIEQALRFASNLPAKQV
jgi:TfoX/Sxy family transcriptional regulator of competence genes